MDLYTLSLMVTFDQEMAIQSLFEHRGWSFNKLKIQNFSREKSVSEDSNINHIEPIPHYVNYVQQSSCTGEQCTRSLTEYGSVTPKSYHNLDNSSISNKLPENSLSGYDLSKPQHLSKLSPITSMEKPVSLDEEENCTQNINIDVTSTANYVLPYVMKAFSLNMDENQIKEKIIDIMNTAFAENLALTDQVEKNSKLDTTCKNSDDAVELDSSKNNEISIDRNESNLNDNQSSNEKLKDCEDEMLEVDISDVIDAHVHVVNKDEINEQPSVNMDIADGSLNQSFEGEDTDVGNDNVSPITIKESKVGNNVKLEQVRDGQKLERSSKRKLSKLRWTVNKNLRMHKYHRKCPTKPCDLSEDMYSPSEKGYYCNDCQFIFVRKSKLILHKELKRGCCLPECIYCDADNEHKEVYQCNKCLKCFQTDAMLERHLSVLCKKRFGCNLCSAKFYMAIELKAHIQTDHSDSLQPEHLCDLCGSKFKEKKVLNAHVKYVHSDNRPEKCSFCDKSFKTKSQLKSHLVTHKSISESNLSCEVCGKGFSRKATLIEHVRRHRKEFSFFCNICEKGFYRQYDLEDHTRVHTKDKPFNCKHCDFKSALSSNLTKHMKIHLRQGLK